MEKLYFISTQTAHLFQTIAKIKINYKISKTGKLLQFKLFQEKWTHNTLRKSDLKIVAWNTIFSFCFSQCFIVLGMLFFSMISDHK